MPETEHGVNARQVSSPRESKREKEREIEREREKERKSKIPRKREADTEREREWRREQDCHKLGVNSAPSRNAFEIIDRLKEFQRNTCNEINTKQSNLES